MKITRVLGQEILDSRGLPTIECHLEIGGIWVRAAVPSGASVGKMEALELRDGDAKRYAGKGVLRAIDHIETLIAPALLQKDPDVATMDALMCELDGTSQKSKLGANAILAVSLAVARAQALVNGLELYEFLAQYYSFTPSMPYCLFNIFNGGAHGNNGVPFQEFMIMPVSQPSIEETLIIASGVYHALKDVLKKHGLAVTVGDEGGFASVLHSTKKSEYIVLDLLMQAVERAGYSHQHIVFALDVAASQFYDHEKQRYILGGKELQDQGMIDLYADLCAQFPLFSIEDALDEQDWDGWQRITQQLGSDVQLVGDDIFVTNPQFIQQGIDKHVANAVLIKPNQIGTLTQTMQAIKLAQAAGYKTIISHRSGETNDPFIADLVYATGAGQFKAGAPARGERIAKYNRLLEIERRIG